MTDAPAKKGTPNMDWLLSEPLLDAALAQIKTMSQFQALSESFRVMESSGTSRDIPASIRSKLATKRQALQEHLLDDSVVEFLSASGLGPLVTAKHKWDDVHFMAEAHGVGSSIPMISYTGLSQQELEDGMNAFYKYIESDVSGKLPTTTGSSKEFRDQVGHKVVDAYKELHEAATGEFGGYDPFQSMLDHTPEKVQALILPPTD